MSFKIICETTRIADVQIEKVWENILKVNNIDAKSDKQSEVIELIPMMKVSWKKKTLFTEVLENWKLEKISFKKTKIIASRTYRNFFYLFISFFLKRSAQKKFDKNVEEIILASL